MSLLQIHEPGETPAPHDRTWAIGIDLGTTHCVVSVMKDDKAMALEDGQGRSIIPSALWHDGQTLHIGYDAFAQAAAKAEHPLQSVKRMMGLNTEEVRAQRLVASDILVSEDKAMPELLFAGTQHSPISLSAELLRYIKALADAALDQDTQDVVITVPAYFDDAARHATAQAAQLAGLTLLRLINEPTAAALAYGLENQSTGTYAVYDLGGGTFDMSLLTLEQGVFQVLATAGDTHLGGDDIDEAIAEYLTAKYELSHYPHAHLKALSRQLKETLGADDATSEILNDMQIILHDHELDELVQPFIMRTLECCDRAMRDAGLTKTDLQGVVMVGGSTRLHAVQQAVSEHFATEIFNNLDPDRVVAYGAAIQAHALTQGGDHLLLDVIPLSLGLETMGGLTEKIIYRNTPIPVQASQEFTTFKDGQTAMQVHVVQGEREMVQQCRSLAQFELSGIPPLPAGVARINVSFMVDADGLLTVSAEETRTGIKQSVHIKPSYGLGIEQIESMIRESMEQGRNDIMERLLAETRIDAQRTIEETRSAITQDKALLDKHETLAISKAITETERAITGNDRDAMDAAHERLKQEITPFAERRMNQAIKKALAGNYVADMKG